MVDALRGEFRVQRIPVRGFVGVNGGGGRNDALNEGQAIRFRLGHGRNGAALAFARDNHNAALAGLVLGKAAVDPVFFAVGRLNVAAKIAAVDLNRAGKGSRP